MHATYRPETQEEELFLQIIANLIKSGTLSRNAVLTIIHLCQTPEAMLAFSSWVLDHRNNKEEVPYQEFELMGVANDIHQGVPIREFPQDKA